MDLGLEGKVALVTAASKGLGLASAAALAAEGASVAICARDPDRLAAAAAGIGAGRPRDPGRRHRARTRPHAWSPPRSSGSGGSTCSSPTPAARRRPARWRSPTSRSPQALNANLTTSIRLVREAVPHLRAAGGGRICLITSSAVKQPIPTLALSNTARDRPVGVGEDRRPGPRARRHHPEPRVPGAARHRPRRGTSGFEGPHRATRPTSAASSRSCARSPRGSSRASRSRSTGRLRWASSDRSATRHIRRLPMSATDQRRRPRRPVLGGAAGARAADRHDGRRRALRRPARRSRARRAASDGSRSSRGRSTSSRASTASALDVTMRTTLDVLESIAQRDVGGDRAPVRPAAGREPPLGTGPAARRARLDAAHRHARSALDRYVARLSAIPAYPRRDRRGRARGRSTLGHARAARRRRARRRRRWSGCSRSRRRTRPPSRRVGPRRRGGRASASRP